MIKKVDEYIVKEKCIRLTFSNQKKCTVFPQRVVFLDGVLSFVGESTVDKSLVCFPFDQIIAVEFYAEVYEARFTPFEINDFIVNTRFINEKEERLVVKFLNGNQTNLLPAHHYLGNPFVTSNLNGDMIWAASIEMCQDVYEWLYELKDQIEVLDPGHIRKEFRLYCEQRKSHDISKKVS